MKEIEPEKRDITVIHRKHKDLPDSVVSDAEMYFTGMSDRWDFPEIEKPTLEQVKGILIRVGTTYDPLKERKRMVLEYLYSPENKKLIDKNKLEEIMNKYVVFNGIKEKVILAANVEINTRGEYTFTDELGQTVAHFTPDYSFIRL